MYSKVLNGRLNSKENSKTTAWAHRTSEIILIPSNQNPRNEWMFLIDKNVVQVVHSFLGVQRISEEHFGAWLKTTFSNHPSVKKKQISTHIIIILFINKYQSDSICTLDPFMFRQSVRRSSKKKNAHSTIGLKLVFNYMYPTVRYFRVLYGKSSTILTTQFCLNCCPYIYANRLSTMDVWQKKISPLSRRTKGRPERPEISSFWLPWN